jgi:hypothetical protein
LFLGSHLIFVIAVTIFFGYAENACSGSEFRKDCCGVVEKNHIVAKIRELNFKRKQMI